MEEIIKISVVLIGRDPIPLPEKARKPLTDVQEFNLHVQHRAVDRAEFDKKVFFGWTNFYIWKSIVWFMWFMCLVCSINTGLVSGQGERNDVQEIQGGS